MLENKARKPLSSALISPSDQKPVNLRLLFAGTIAESYGVFDTFKVADAIHELYPETTYTLCGHCPSTAVLARIKEAAAERPWVRLQLSTTPIPHHTILEHIQKSSFIFVAYRLNPSNEGCMPTRIWEALAWQKPVILRCEHPWGTLIDAYQAGFALDFNHPDPLLLKNKLQPFHYFKQSPPENIYWESQEQAWISCINGIFAK